MSLQNKIARRIVIKTILAVHLHGKKLIKIVICMQMVFTHQTLIAMPKMQLTVIQNKDLWHQLVSCMLVLENVVNRSQI